MHLREIILVLSAAVLAAGSVSCSGAKTSVNSPRTTENTSAAAAETEDLSPEVKDFGGYNFRIVTKQPHTYESLAPDEIDGTLINDLVYNRDLRIAESYNISFSETIVDDASATTRKNVLSNDDFADTVVYQLIYQLTDSADELLYNLKDLGSLRLDMPWWDAEMQETLTINKKLYSILGDITVSDELHIFAVAYNKKLFADTYGDINLYEKVKSGEWTFDYFWNYIRGFAKDINGDNKIDDKDNWGLLYDAGTVFTLFNGSGTSSVIYSDGKYELNIDNENTYDKISKYLVVATSYPDAMMVEKLPGVYDNKSFQNGQVLFLGSMPLLSAADDFRFMSDDFGLLPIPKYDESQDGYHCSMHAHVESLAIPVTCPDSERTALILEALCYDSHNNLNGELYNMFFDEKATRDEESKDMLNIIFKSKIYPIDYIANITGLGGIFSNLSDKNSANFVSEYAKIAESAQVKLDDFIAGY